MPASVCVYITKICNILYILILIYITYQTAQGSEQNNTYTLGDFISSTPSKCTQLTAPPIIISDFDQTDLDLEANAKLQLHTGLYGMHLVLLLATSSDGLQPN